MTRDPEKVREHKRRWRLKNKDKISEYNKSAHARELARIRNTRYRKLNRDKSLRYQEDNRERINAAAVTRNRLNPIPRREANKKYYQNHKNKVMCRINKRKKARYHAEPAYRLMVLMKTRIRTLLKGIDKSKRTIDLLGCSPESFKRHLESQFAPSMSWSNYGSGDGKWVMDHIKPCSLFDFRNPEEQKACFHYSNLRPMWWRNNLMKSNKDMNEYFGELSLEQQGISY